MAWIFGLMPIGYLCGNIYISRRGWQALAALPLVVRLLLLLLYWGCALSLFGTLFFRSPDLPPVLRQGLHRIGTGWLVFTLYMTLGLLTVDLLRLLRVVRGRGFGWVLAATLLLLGCGYCRYRHPVTRTEELTIDRLSGSMRVVAVSDLHLGYGTGRRMLARYVDRINALQPDLILIGGDLIDHGIEPLCDERMEEELQRLQAPLGIYMVPGNHEYFGGMDQTLRFLARTPVRLLRDSVAVLPNGVQVIGRDDRSNPHRLPLDELLAGTDPDRPRLLLDHQPYALAETVQAGIDLQFSGHTHRGQVWPLSWVTDCLFEQSHGCRQWGATHICVSSGLSLWGPPFRIGTQSEVVVLELHGRP